MVSVAHLPCLLQDSEVLFEGRANLAQQLNQRVAQEAGVGWLGVEGVGGRPGTTTPWSSLIMVNSQPWPVDFSHNLAKANHTVLALICSLSSTVPARGGCVIRPTQSSSAQRSSVKTACGKSNGRKGKPDSLVEVEATCGGGDTDVSLLNSQHIHVHKITMHLPVARGGVPATHSQDFQALHGL